MLCLKLRLQIIKVLWCTPVDKWIYRLFYNIENRWYIKVRVYQPFTIIGGGDKTNIFTCDVNYASNTRLYTQSKLKHFWRITFECKRCSLIPTLTLSLDTVVLNTNMLRAHFQSLIILRREEHYPGPRLLVRGIWYLQPPPALHIF